MCSSNLARRIALVAPYPIALAGAGVAYWQAAGITVTRSLRVDPALTDTHRIYELTSDDALVALRKLDADSADCIVVSGTGMPTLAALRACRSEFSKPVISSNASLAWCLLRAVAPDLAPSSPAELLP